MYLRRGGIFTCLTAVMLSVLLKNFENRSTFGEVGRKNRMRCLLLLLFFWLTDTSWQSAFGPEGPRSPALLPPAGMGFIITGNPRRSFGKLGCDRYPRLYDV